MQQCHKRKRKKEFLTNNNLNQKNSKTIKETYPWKNENQWANNKQLKL